MPTQCSREVEIVSPMNPLSLVVPRGSKAQADLLHSLCMGHRQEEAAIQLQAVEGERVDFSRRVETPYQPVSVAPCPAAPSNEHVSVSRSPLALHAYEPTIQVEDHVVAAAFRNRPIDVDSESRRRQLDRKLRDRSFLICCHERQPTERLGWAMSV
jgi:hypothetical protein